VSRAATPVDVISGAGVTVSGRKSRPGSWSTISSSVAGSTSVSANRVGRELGRALSGSAVRELLFNRFVITFPVISSEGFDFAGIYRLIELC